MISILIPVFNQDINKLVARLSAGLSHLQQGGEIIVMDDGSDPAFRDINKPIAQQPFVRYLPQAQNQGRIRIRQMLAEAAAGEWLLFLDGDSEVVSDNFLHNYIQAIQPGAAVVVGGRTYTATPPEDDALRLHWKYGSRREGRLPGKKHQPAFMSNNFLIQARYFQQLSFHTGWNGYGHEDTWMGLQLEEAGIPVRYIDNPVIHGGLEKNSAFIAKSATALLNLHQLSGMVPAALLARHVKIFRVYKKLEVWRCRWIVLAAYALLKNYIHRNLHSSNPSLTLFDLYRLQYFIRLVNSAH
ncbi:glycosyltransferase family 2 protein [Pseudoflavitalea sp. X16]|uniref:glycosyltransferase family 2 protein n=1 Tax=Paraflavitalea devenefica TaxID=2716334 RepID=UPI001423F329|nr:glycosyltransferase family 2 protein [Paraflavitalea devenefica]NII28681.1 glycosyltransferase family 2 protein [Paraflavitalea devenefica]